MAIFAGADGPPRQNREIVADVGGRCVTRGRGTNGSPNDGGSTAPFTAEDPFPPLCSAFHFPSLVVRRGVERRSSGIRRMRFRLALYPGLS